MSRHAHFGILAMAAAILAGCRAPQGEQALGDVAPLVERDLLPLLMNEVPPIVWEKPKPGTQINPDDPKSYFIRGTLQGRGGWIVLSGTYGTSFTYRVLFCVKTKLNWQRDLSLEEATTRMKVWFKENGVDSSITDGLQGTGTVNNFKWTSIGLSSLVGGTIEVHPALWGVEFRGHVLHNAPWKRIG